MNTPAPITPSNRQQRPVRFPFRRGHRDFIGVFAFYCKRDLAVEAVDDDVAVGGDDGDQVVRGAEDAEGGVDGGGGDFGGEEGELG